jgi:hypothetical protein
MAADHARAPPGAVSGFNAITQSGLTGVAAAGMAFAAGGLGARAMVIAAATVMAVTGAIAPCRGRVGLHR